MPKVCQPRGWRSIDRGRSPSDDAKRAKVVDLAQEPKWGVVVSAEDRVRAELRAIRERQVRMRSELRHLNERHAVLRGKYSSLSDHALSLEGALEEALIALDDQKPEEAKGLLGDRLGGGEAKKRKRKRIAASGVGGLAPSPPGSRSASSPPSWAAGTTRRMSRTPECVHEGRSPRRSGAAPSVTWPPACRSRCKGARRRSRRG